MKKLVTICFCLMAIIPVASCENGAEPASTRLSFTDLSGPYFGQEPPGETPQLFLPGLVSTHWSETYIAFLEHGTVCSFSTITDDGLRSYYTWIKNGRWTEPEQAPFEELQGHPNYTAGADDKTIYFHSGRPTYIGDERPDDNIWGIEWTGAGWAEPFSLPSPANSEYGEAYPTMSADGTVYFFAWSRPDTLADDIYRSRFSDGEYQPVERLPWPINTDYIEYDPYIAPDGSYLIFGSTRPGGYGSADLYISFQNEDGTWSDALNLGSEINSAAGDLCPNGTPDGRYFFYSSGRGTDIYKGDKNETRKEESDHDIYWIESSVFNRFRETILGKQNAARLFRETCGEAGLDAALADLMKRFTTEQHAYYFPAYELLHFCGSMLDEGKPDDADRLYSTMLELYPPDVQVMYGYSLICAMHGDVDRARELWLELDEDDPAFDLAGTYGNVGNLLSMFPEKSAQAKRILQLSIDDDPDSPYPHYSLARIFRSEGDLDAAIVHCRKAVELYPSFGDAVSLLERLQVEMEEK